MKFAQNKRSWCHRELCYCCFRRRIDKCQRSVDINRARRFRNVCEILAARCAIMPQKHWIKAVRIFQFLEIIYDRFAAPVNAKSRLRKTGTIDRFSGEKRKIHGFSQIYESKLRPSAIVPNLGRTRRDALKSHKIFGSWRTDMWLFSRNLTTSCVRLLAAKSLSMMPLNRVGASTMWTGKVWHWMHRHSSYNASWCLP